MGCSSSGMMVEHLKSTRVETVVAQNDFLDDYSLGKMLGYGAFAQVRAATKVSTKRFPPKEDQDQTNVERAVKILRLAPGKSTEKLAKEELNIWATVGAHPNCVRLIDMYFAEKFCFMVMEKCSSSLYAALEGMPELNEQSLGKVFVQMLVGIVHCHSVGVVHRDIKPDNFLVGGEDFQTLKLCDFGCSALIKKKGKLRGVYGTAPYMSPEMLQSCSYDEKTDVWSFGVIVYVLLFGRFPYMPKQGQYALDMKQAIVNGTPSPTYKPTTPPDGPHTPRISQRAISFTSCLLNRESEGRPTAQQALTLPWTDSVRKDCLWNGEVLDSLRPMIYAAKKVGAFDMRDALSNTKFDQYIKVAMGCGSGKLSVEASMQEARANPLQGLPALKDALEQRANPSQEETAKNNVPQVFKLLPKAIDSIRVKHPRAVDAAGAVIKRCVKLVNDPSVGTHPPTLDPEDLKQCINHFSSLLENNQFQGRDFPFLDDRDITYARAFAGAMEALFKLEDHATACREEFTKSGLRMALNCMKMDSGLTPTAKTALLTMFVALLEAPESTQDLINNQGIDVLLPYCVDPSGCGVSQKFQLLCTELLENCIKNGQGIQNKAEVEAAITNARHGLHPYSNCA